MFLQEIILIMLMVTAFGICGWIIMVYNEKKQGEKRFEQYKATLPEAERIKQS